MPIQQLRVMRGIRGMLTFGRQRKPSQIVVLLHGLNDTAKDCSSGVVARWVKGLPEALFVVPQSSDRTSWSSDCDPGYDWVPTKSSPPWETFEEFGARSPHYRESLREYRHVLLARCRHVSAWLDALLARHGLSDRDLVLAGFSLGSYLSAIIGAHRNVRGVIVCGGVPCTQELRFKELMPKMSHAHFCAVNGTRDTLVQRPSLEAMLRPYKCEWNWSKGVGHDFPSEWYATELKWMQRLFRK